MRDKPIDFLFDDDASSPQRLEALRAQMAADPDLAAAVARWRRACVVVAQRMQADLPDRDVLVRYALEGAGYAEALTEDEQALLAATRADLEQALAAHPGLNDVVRDMQEACADFDVCWEAARPSSPVRSDRAAVARSRSAGGMRWGWRLAAGFALVAFAVVSLFLIQRDQNVITVTTEPGEVRLVTLADGSTVRLMGGSSLVYPDPSRPSVLERHTQLRGDAFFTVVPAQSGFVVETATARATVLGTSFGVRAEEAMTEVVLATGRLALASREAPERMVVLQPGQMSRVAASALPSTPAPVEVAEALTWTDQFVFNATPLAQIARRLSNHYGVRIAVHDVLVDEPITGTFSQEQPLREILDTIAATLNAQVAPIPNGGFTLGPRREE